VEIFLEESKNTSKNYQFQIIIKTNLILNSPKIIEIGLLTFKILYKQIGFQNKVFY
jgi:hypothetical protein